MAKAKKIDPPWAAETVPVPKAAESTRKSKDKALQMTVHMNGEHVELSFATRRELEVAKITVSTRCARGAVATVTTAGKEYMFVPQLGYITTSAAD